MGHDKEEQIRVRAYQLWEKDGRPDGHHDDHWSRAEKEVGSDVDPHPGMMGDGTEEQSLNQTGNPSARITEDDVKEAFKANPTSPGSRKS